MSWVGVGVIRETDPDLAREHDGSLVGNPYRECECSRNFTRGDT